MTISRKYTKIRMAEQSDWTFEFYLKLNGSSPVEEFLDTLDLKTRARFKWSIEQLRVRNISAREPLARHIEGALWELREESRTNIYRIIYFFYTGRRIVFLHGFHKKTRHTPVQELGIARSRYLEFVARERRW